MRTRSRSLLAMVVALVLLCAAPASALPAPAVPVSPDSGSIDAVFGTNATGDTFVNVPDPARSGYRIGAVRHADGTVTLLTKELGGPAVVASDGRLWAALDGSLWSVAPDGTMVDHPIVAPEAVATTGITKVAKGPGGRIWFLDRDRSSIGSVAADGTDPVVWPVPGTGALSRLAAGADGRMWVTRDGGGLQAVAADGAVSTYATLGKGVEALQATTGSLYAVVEGDLVKIAANGTRSVVRAGTDITLTDGGASGGWVWFASPTSVLAVSPSGRVALFAMPQAWTVPTYRPVLSIAPDARGGYVASVGGRLARIASPAISETFTASGRVVDLNGFFVLRVTATGATPGGTPLAGRVDVVLWGTALYGDQIGLLSERRATVAGSLELVRGRGTVDIPITAGLVRAARPGGLLHTFCCSLTVRRPGTTASPGISSPMGTVTGGPQVSYYGPVVPSTTAAWLDDLSVRAIGRPLGTADQVRLAGDLAAGRASRVSVTRGVVATASWKHHRADQAFQRWFGRHATSSEATYWAGRLVSGTTSALDLALATKPAARDATGTTNTARAAHLAAALHLPASYASGYRSKLDAGTPWATLVRDAYGSSAAKAQRIADMGPRSSFTPSVSALGSMLASGDERQALIAVLATLPAQNLGY